MHYCISIKSKTSVHTLPRYVSLTPVSDRQVSTGVSSLACSVKKTFICNIVLIKKMGIKDKRNSIQKLRDNIYMYVLDIGNVLLFVMEYFG